MQVVPSREFLSGWSERPLGPPRYSLRDHFAWLRRLLIFSANKPFTRIRYIFLAEPDYKLLKFNFKSLFHLIKIHPPPPQKIQKTARFSFVTNSKHGRHKSMAVLPLYARRHRLRVNIWYHGRHAYLPSHSLPSMVLYSHHHWRLLGNSRLRHARCCVLFPRFGPNLCRTVNSDRACASL